jgi:hypothetical protein
MEFVADAAEAKCSDNGVRNLETLGFEFDSSGMLREKTTGKPANEVDIGGISKDLVDAATLHVQELMVGDLEFSEIQVPPVEQRTHPVCSCGA